jgi:transglutaminase-like putative cysteine protease
MLRPPPFALGAALLLWGAVAGFLPAAAILAAAIEAPRFHALRFDLRARDFERIADLCTAALVVALVYLLLRTRHFSESLVSALLWLPMLTAPLILAQRYSLAGQMPLTALFWSLRRRHAHVPGTAQPVLVDLGYFCVCLLAATAANLRSPWFYAALCAFLLYALWPQRAPGARRAAWPALAALAVVLGFGMQLGLSTLQSTIEEAAVDWLNARWQGQADPYRARTAIGDIGSLKFSERIVLRVDVPQSTGVPLLRVASYNRYAGGSWIASAPSFQPLPALGDGWAVGDGPGVQRLHVSGWMTRGRALLALPPNTVRLAGLRAESVQRNAMGAVRVEHGPDPLTYEVWFDPQGATDMPPGADDLALPAAVAAPMREVVRELGLHREDSAAAVAAVRAFFASGFSYSLDLDASGGGSRSLLRFLLQDRRGHCEYFASATVLLLRAAGVPARYATGYAVQEWSTLEDAYVVRARHAHAWALAWTGRGWQEVDTTPAVWADEEAQRASPLQPLHDLFSALYYRFARWRAAPADGQGGSMTWVWLAVPLAGYLLWRVWRRRTQLETGAAAAPRRIEQHVRLAPLLARLAAQGYVRPSGTPLLAWVKGLPLAEEQTHALLEQVVRGYYQARFDPDGLPPARAQMLAAQSAAVIARLDAALSAASAPPTPAG